MGSGARLDERPELWICSYPGQQPYGPMWELQRALAGLRQAGLIPDTLLLLEHRPVVTLGRNADRRHLLSTEAEFAAEGIDLVEVDRGGDVTYHGPGQLVGYWIFDLKAHRPDVHLFVRNVEEVLIRTLSRLGVDAGRSPGATGVWVSSGPDRPAEKIAAIGIHVSHWVTTHGFALNLATDLAPFGRIVPCGLHGRGVTTLARLADVPSPRGAVEDILAEEVSGLFGMRAVPIRPAALASAIKTRGQTICPV